MSELNIFWNKINAEKIYNIWNFKEQHDDLKINSIESIEKILLWSDKSIDIKIKNEDYWYWIILENKEESEKLNNIINEFFIDEDNIDKIDDKR